MHKSAKTNSIRRNLRVAKKKPIGECGFVDKLSEAYRWLAPLMFVYNNFDGIKSIFEQLFK